MAERKNTATTIGSFIGQILFGWLMLWLGATSGIFWPLVTWIGLRSTIAFGVWAGRKEEANGG